MSKNDRLCAHMREVLNKNLKEYGPGYDERKYKDAIFSAISWQSIGLHEGFDYGGDVARFDINNDGTTDVVVRLHTSGVRDITLQRLFIFKEDQYPDSAKKARELNDNAVGSVNIFSIYEFRVLPQKTFEVPGLKGKKYFEGLNIGYIYPFRFENTNYLMLKRSPDSGPDPYWVLVAKYLGGKVDTADSTMMEDICYLK